MSDAKDARIEKGEECHRCGTYILRATGVRSLCWECQQMDDNPDEAGHDTWIRCPKCGYVEDTAYLDNNDIYDPNDVTDVTCGECEHEYTIETSVSFTFTSPARVCEHCGGEGTLSCSACGGSGEGMADGTTCHTCKGHELPCECQADRLRDEEDAREASRENAYEARRDGD